VERLFVVLEARIMICPHCKQEVEGIIPQQPIVNLNLAAAAANPMPSIMLNSVCAAPAAALTFTPTYINFNANGCAGVQPIHYCTF